MPGGPIRFSEISHARQPAQSGLTGGLLESLEGMSAIRVCDRESEPAPAIIISHEQVEALKPSADAIEMHQLGHPDPICEPVVLW